MKYKCESGSVLWKILFLVQYWTTTSLDPNKNKQTKFYCIYNVILLFKINIYKQLKSWTSHIGIKSQTLWTTNLPAGLCGMVSWLNEYVLKTKNIQKILTGWGRVKVWRKLYEYIIRDKTNKTEIRQR